jgi:hypothetical protein
MKVAKENPTPKPYPNIKFQVSDVPVGLYRSFKKRGWPIASYPDTSSCAMISCDKEYVPREIREHRVFDLRVKIAVYNESGYFEWRYLGTYKRTLQEVKLFIFNYVAHHPEIYPPQYRTQNETQPSSK